MMIEIGSEYWTGCTPLDGNGVKPLLPTGMDIHYTLCGRTALELVLRDAVAERRIRKAYLPSYCCHTMIEPFVAKGIDVLFYNVFFSDNGIECDFLQDNGCDLVFLLDYFGFRDAATVQRATAQKALGKCVVYDATHAMFCDNMDYSAYDYVFGSFRKWFGVNAGFCAKHGQWRSFPALKKNWRYTNSRNEAFLNKQQFMAGKPLDKNDYLCAFSWAEEHLGSHYIGYGPDAESMKLLQTVNVEFIRRRRRENAITSIDIIHAMSDQRICSPYRLVGEDECPLFIPLRVEPSLRTELRSELIRQQVYLPIHWPISELHEINDVSKRIYLSELSFVCDQRYEKDDMDRAIRIIRSV